MLDALGRIEAHAKITDVLFVRNILDSEWSCGRCGGVEGRRYRKDWLDEDTRPFPVSAQTQCSRCVSAHDGGSGQGEWFFWRAALVCLQVILPRCVSTSKHWLQFACLTSNRGEGGFGWWWWRRESRVGGHSAALRTCRMWAEQLSACTLFLFSFKEWNPAGRGAVGYAELVTQGERESFSWTQFMDVLGSADGNGGRLGGPLLPLGSWRCQSKEKGERESEHRMCWACPVLISVKNRPPSQPSHSAAPACTQVDSAGLWGNAPIWQGRGDKSKRGVNMISCQATLKLIFMY